MDIQIKELEAIMYDIKLIISDAETCRSEIDRGINVNASPEYEETNLRKTVENLLEYLIDAKHDMDRLRDKMLDVHTNLGSSLEEMEYENLAQKAKRLL